MEAKDKLTLDDCLKLYEEEGIMGLVEKVREISFKAGEDKGRKEVVDWARDNFRLNGVMVSGRPAPGKPIQSIKEEVQAKLKEWEVVVE